MEKTSFVLYHEIRQPLEMLSYEERGRLFTAILDYSERGAVPDFSGALAMAFCFVRQGMDRNAEKWNETRAARAKAGRRGGRRRAENLANAAAAGQAEENAENPEDDAPSGQTKQNEANPANASLARQTKQSKANVAVPVPVPEPVPVPVPERVPVPVPVRVPEDTLPSGEGESAGGGARARKAGAFRFTPPTVEEVESFAREAGPMVDAARFCDYYASNGWLVGGKAKMRDWRAAARNWARKESGREGGGRGRPYRNGEAPWQRDDYEC